MGHCGGSIGLERVESVPLEAKSRSLSLIDEVSPFQD